MQILFFCPLDMKEQSMDFLDKVKKHNMTYRSEKDKFTIGLGDCSIHWVFVFQLLPFVGVNFFL